MQHGLSLFLAALREGHREQSLSKPIYSLRRRNELEDGFQKLQHLSVAGCMLLLYKLQHVLAIKLCFSWIKCRFVSLWTITMDSHGALYQLMHFSQNTKGVPFKLKVTLLITAIPSLTTHLPFHEPFYVFPPRFSCIIF